MNPLELRTLPIADLLPASYNPRTVSKKAYAKLKASLETFGLVEPLIWNQRTGHVVGGHLRLRILHDLGVADVPVSVVSLSDAEEKALNVVLNNLEAQGRYDPVKLAEVLTTFGDVPMLEATGFTLATIKALTLVPEEVPVEADCDAVEITLTATRSGYEALSPRLDTLIRDFDLQSHVREAPLSARACSATTAAEASPP